MGAAGVAAGPGAFCRREPVAWERRRVWTPETVLSNNRDVTHSSLLYACAARWSLILAWFACISGMGASFWLRQPDGMLISLNRSSLSYQVKAVVL